MRQLSQSLTPAYPVDDDDLRESFQQAQDLLFYRHKDLTNLMFQNDLDISRTHGLSTGGKMSSKNQKNLNLSRMGIFALQLLVIATLLWASEYSRAGGDDDGSPNNKTPACETESCKKTSPTYNTIPIPYQYRRNPPDAGFWYQSRRDDNNGKVWVPGLTDTMNSSTKEAYYDLKNGPLKGGWSQVRVSIADALLLVQNYPSTTCHDNMQAAASGSVRMVCTYSEGGTQKTKTYKNLTTMSFNDYFDENFTTISEYHSQQMQTDDSNTTPYGQYYDSHGNLIYSDSTTQNSGEASFSNNSSGVGYSRYISNHVAPNYKNINRSTAAVFSQGNEIQRVTLEDILKKKDAEYSPGIKENNSATAKTEEIKQKPESSGTKNDL